MIKVPFDNVFTRTNFPTFLNYQAIFIDGHGEANSLCTLGGHTFTNAANRNQKLRFDDSAVCEQQSIIYADRLRFAAATSNGQEFRVTAGELVDGSTGNTSYSDRIYKVNENMTVTAITNNTMHIPSGYSLVQQNHVMLSDQIDVFQIGGISEENTNFTLTPVKFVTRFRWDDTVAPYSQGFELNQTSGYAALGHNGSEGIIWRSEGGGAASTTAELFKPAKGMNNDSRLVAELSTTFPECVGMSACSGGDAAFRCDGYDVASSTEVTTIRSLRYDDIATALQMTNTLAYRMRQQFTASSGIEMMSVGGRSDADSVGFTNNAQRIRFDDTATAIQQTNELNLAVRSGGCASI